ncbi:MAG: gamma carbonic anhydrase family protein, partial [Desulfobacteraceae bacterium]|nr:gamma carbonic anhydrase family protein [Desulfobacteraceae bacterium]
MTGFRPVTAILSIFSETGEWSIVGEGSLVRANQKIPSNAVAVGNPAKEVRDVNDGDRELWTYGKQVYVDLAKKHLDQSMKLVG